MLYGTVELQEVLTMSLSLMRSQSTESLAEQSKSLKKCFEKTFGSFWNIHPPPPPPTNIV